MLPWRRNDQKSVSIHPPACIGQFEASTTGLKKLCPIILHNFSQAAGTVSKYIRSWRHFTQSYTALKLYQSQIWSSHSWFDAEGFAVRKLIASKLARVGLKPEVVCCWFESLSWWGTLWSQDSWLTGTKQIQNTLGHLSANYPFPFACLKFRGGAYHQLKVE